MISISTLKTMFISKIKVMSISRINIIYISRIEMNPLTSSPPSMSTLTGLISILTWPGVSPPVM